MFVSFFKQKASKLMFFSSLIFRHFLACLGISILKNSPCSSLDELFGWMCVSLLSPGKFLATISSPLFFRPLFPKLLMAGVGLGSILHGFCPCYSPSWCSVFWAPRTLLLLFKIAAMFFTFKNAYFLIAPFSERLVLVLGVQRLLKHL